MAREISAKALVKPREEDRLRKTGQAVREAVECVGTTGSLCFCEVRYISG